MGIRTQIEYVKIWHKNKLKFINTRMEFKFLASNTWNLNRSKSNPKDI